MNALDPVDKDIKKFYDKSIKALGKLEKIPTKKEWSKIARKKFYMTSISLMAYSKASSWILLYLNARRLYNKNKWAI